MNYGYRVLNRLSFHKDNYSLVPIRMEDRYAIMQWRNEQIYHLRQSKPLTKEDQDRYFENVIKKLFEKENPDQLLFSYLEGDKCIGYGGLVHINWLDKNAEVSFIMETRLEEKEFHKHWGIYLDLLNEIAFEELDLHKIYTYAFDLRPHLYEAIEVKGFVREAVLKEHCFIDNEYKDVIIHSKFINNLTIREINSDDKNITFEWANDELTRQNSFDCNPISFETHSMWFDSKINNKNSFYYMSELNGNPVGLVRFDTKDNKLIIGITISQKYRGQGLSSKLLRDACDIVRKKSKLPIVALIKKENIPSLKSFEKAGFKFQNEIKINDIESYEYLYQK